MLKKNSPRKSIFRGDVFSSFLISQGENERKICYCVAFQLIKYQKDEAKSYSDGNRWRLV